MSSYIMKTIASVALAGTLALTASSSPASAYYRHGGYHGGWHRGGGWGWAPFVLGGLAAGAIVAGAAAPYYYGGPYYGGPYYGDPCYRLTPTYNQYGAYVGRHWSYVCQ